MTISQTGSTSSYFSLDPVSSMGILVTLSAWAVAFLSLFLPPQLIQNVKILFKTLPRDIKCGILAFRVITRSLIDRKLNVNSVDRFKKVASKHSHKACFLYEDEVWTFKEVEDYSSKVAQIFQKSGFKKGDVISLVMTNQPAYPCVWLGLAKIGVVTALINSNLRSKPLVHCIKSASSKAVIFSEDLAPAIESVKYDLPADIKYFQLGESETVGGTINLSEVLTKASVVYRPEKRLGYNDHLVYVYTSGTTGLPKAAIVPHSRFLLMLHFGHTLLDWKTDDIIYDPLPLYHTAGGLLGVSAAFLTGATVVLKKKFSANKFISDCSRYNCTVAQYIGEICRYVLAVPEQPTDKQHKLRMIAGNGLRPTIWSEFVKRFNIPKVLEMYGSTEGNLQFVNIEGKIGAVGFLPRFLPFRKFIGAIIQVNDETMEPIRGENGLCVECDIDEPGMFVGIIPSKNSVKEFHGYLDNKESRKKYLYDVFKKGDKAFVSGDLMVMDELGYLYFKDRTGDTFRWKGENVATSEVEAIISSIIGLKDCIVYGVQVGELEGRAGMAAIAEPSGFLDFDDLANKLNVSLPSYARPLFIRLIPEIERTGTFKLIKITLMKEGFNPYVIKDPIFFWKGSTYVRLTNEMYEDILSGKIRV